MGSTYQPLFLITLNTQHVWAVIDPFAAACHFHSHAMWPLGCFP
jgi:hypothetical protein